jgi:hypothetical protein
MKPTRSTLIAVPCLILAGLTFMAMTSAATANEKSETVKLAGLEWAQTTTGEDMRWPDAVEYCEKLTLGGHDDWRLPTLSELESLHDPEADYGIREPFAIDTCCLWSNESLVDRPAEDGDEIGGSPDRYQWGFMFDGGHHYYAVHIFEDGQALCTRNIE